jgi:DNA-binding response OmpR family regulator
MRRILLIDDDELLATPLATFFKRFEFELDSATRPSAGLAKLRSQAFDAAILDVMLPEMDGFALCREIRRESDIPIIMLTARGDVMDRVVGLEIGADDYLPKPFTLGELLARVRSLVRRQSSVKQSVLEHNGVRLDLLGHTVQVDGQDVDLTSREYALLEVFMQNRGRILPRTLIAEKVWVSNYDMDMNLLDVYMSRLRAKLETTSRKTLFKTVRGVGYQFL